MSLYFLELTECIRPRVNHDVNYKLQVNMMGQYRLINCNKRATLVEDFNNGGDYACRGQGIIWEISVPYFQFCCEPQTPLKK